MEEIIETILSSLSAIRNPRFYDTERGFQGELGAEIQSRLPGLQLDGAIVEHEYQKRIKDHGFRIRPDLIIHVPFLGSSFDGRDEGNFVVIELKRHANSESARHDYQNLSQMCKVLGYPLAVFINIDSEETFIDMCEEIPQAVVSAFAVKLVNGEVQIIKQSRPE